jgi:hypothetical protein
MWITHRTICSMSIPWYVSMWMLCELTALLQSNSCMRLPKWARQAMCKADQLGGQLLKGYLESVARWSWFSGGPRQGATAQVQHVANRWLVIGIGILDYSINGHAQLRKHPYSLWTALSCC